MTTIILTIIGILLAAAAALMVIFYGGDAFNGGSIGAQANTYQNAGTNVISAVQLAKADGQVNVSAMTSLDDLKSETDPSKDYLKEVPTLNEAGAVTFNGSQFTAVVGGADAAKVCARINKNLKITTAPTAVVTTVKMGCATTGTIFFANA